jgi:terminase small subunit / prophage DNA-packing protein
MSQIVNRHQIAEIMDVSQQTISDWLAKGMPVIDRGAAFNDGSYDTGAVVRWYVDWKIAGVKGESQKDRLDRVTADLRELDLQQRQGKLVDFDLVVTVLANLVNITRTAVLAAAVAPEIPEACRPLIKARLDDALRELAEYDPAELVKTD